MPQSPPQFPRKYAKTLAEANVMIEALIKTPGSSLPAGTPIPKLPVPATPPGKNPDPSRTPGSPGTFNLSLMSPKARDAFLEEQTTPALYKLIKKENDPVVYNAIYRVIKKRPDR
jgi:hypothetical protein